MLPYRYLLFDADGTLFDFAEAEKQALRRSLQRHQITYDDQIKALYSQINQQLWQALEQGQIDKACLQTERFSRLLQQTGLRGSAQQLNKTYMAELSRCSDLIAGAETVCRQLAERYNLAIITNGIGGVQHPRFKRSPLVDIIKDLFISEEIGFAKPHVAFFQYVLCKLRIADRSEALVIGDSLTADIAGGINAGLDTCWYNPARQSPDHHIKPTYEIDRLEKIPELLFGENR